MSVIAIMNEKGGVGKSAVTYSIAWCLAEGGAKVLLIDMDGQNANLSYLANVPSDINVKTMVDVLLKKLPIRDAVQEVDTKDLSGSIHMIPANTDMAMLSSTAKISTMKKVIRDIASDYDYIFLDVSPAPDWKHALVLSVVDVVYVLMLADVVSLEANSGILDSIEEVQSSTNSALKLGGFIFNQFDGRLNITKAVMKKMDSLTKELGVDVVPYTIRKSVAMQEAAVRHEGVTSYAKKSNIASDIEALTDELERRL